MVKGERSDQEWAREEEGPATEAGVPEAVSEAYLFSQVDHQGVPWALPSWDEPTWSPLPWASLEPSKLE